MTAWLGSSVVETVAVANPGSLGEITLCTWRNWSWAVWPTSFSSSSGGLTVEDLGRTPAHRHTLQKDLEVLHDLGDRRVDGELEGQRPMGGVHGKYGGLCREVHTVVDVEGLQVLVPDPRAVDVGLVGEDQRRPLRGHRLADPLLVVADGPQHDAHVLQRHAQLRE